ncbi:MAG: cobalamin biosynthesis protein [Rhodospirillales bacterium]
MNGARLTPFRRRPILWPMFLFGINIEVAAFDPLILLLLALLVDTGIGGIVNRWRLAWHPVNLLAGLVGWCDRKLNREHRPEMDRAMRGLVATLLLLAAAAGLAWSFAWATQNLPLMWIVETALILMLLDQRGVHARVRRAARAITANNADQARLDMAPLAPGRTARMDLHAVARSGIEGCGRALAAGVIGPVFWYLLFGFPGLLVFKLLSVMDLVVGHRTARHRAFGFAAARTNEILLFIPARLAGILVVLASLFVPTTNPKAALATMLRDAGKYRSKNLGWPIGAMAGALGVSLGGGDGGGDHSGEPWLGAGSARASGLDMRRGLYIFAVACLINGLLVAALIVARLIDGGPG